MKPGTKAAVDVDAHAAVMLTRARKAGRMFEAPTGAEHKAKLERAALTTLVKNGMLVDLGQRGRKRYYSIAQGSARETILSLARDALRKRGHERLTLCDANSKAFDRDSSLPTKVRAALPEALRVLNQAGEAHVLQAGRARYFILRTDLEQTLAAMQRLAAQHGAVPMNDVRPAPADDDLASRVRKAYRALRTETGRTRILVSDVFARSHVPLAELHRFLDEECTHHRANPSRGEFTAATSEQRAAALSIDGEPHLYIELFE